MDWFTWTQIQGQQYVYDIYFAGKLLMLDSLILLKYI